MTPAEMSRLAVDAIVDGTRMTMVVKKGWRKPAKFPRGELLCENSDGRNAFSFDPLLVLTWLRAKGHTCNGKQ